MGSWGELDARYEPGKLTPAVAFIVAMTHIAGADGIYLEEEEGSLPAFLSKHGLGALSYDALLDQAEAYLEGASLEQFLEEASTILNHDQKLCILLNMINAALADGMLAPEEHDLFKRFLQAFNIAEDEIKSYLKSLYIKNNLTLFPQ